MIFCFPSFRIWSTVPVVEDRPPEDDGRMRQGAGKNHPPSGQDWMTRHAISLQRRCRKASRITVLEGAEATTENCDGWMVFQEPNLFLQTLRMGTIVPVQTHHVFPTTSLPALIQCSRDSRSGQALNHLNKWPLGPCRQGFFGFNLGRSIIHRDQLPTSGNHPLLSLDAVKRQIQPFRRGVLDRHQPRDNWMLKVRAGPIHSHHGHHVHHSAWQRHMNAIQICGWIHHGHPVEKIWRPLATQIKVPGPRLKFQSFDTF